MPGNFVSITAITIIDMAITTISVAIRNISILAATDTNS